ncbi:MAG: hypothetical protein ABIP61_09670, partial [Burkholderiaceae bacterium]
QFLDSIKRMKALPLGTLVLPSHGRPFGGAVAAGARPTAAGTGGAGGLHTRIDQLVAHHDERFAEVLQACAEAPQTAADLLPVLFRRPLDLHQTTFAMGESLAHLHALWFNGQLERRLDADGIYRFTPAA